MPPTLTDEQEQKVAAARKTAKPTVYDPDGKTATTISPDFEAWLILTSSSLKSKAMSWITSLTQSDPDDAYQDLLHENDESLKTGLDHLQSIDSAKSSAFSSWRSNSGISGWEDVREISWLFQELQQRSTETEELKYQQALRTAVYDRCREGKNSSADRNTRLKAWISALSTY